MIELLVFLVGLFVTGLVAGALWEVGQLELERQKGEASSRVSEPAGEPEEAPEPVQSAR